MVKQRKFYVTTAIDYLNAEPHIGHGYQKIIADVLARWHKVKGEKVWFLTGTDEHGLKVSRAAKEKGLNEKEFVDILSKNFKEAWTTLNIVPDRFIRTTDKDHKKIVQKMIQKCKKSGDIYLSEYEGLYCVGCEKYYTEKDLINWECPFHPGKKLEMIKEKSYFFRLSKYEKFLLDLYKKHPEFILPKERRNEIIARVKEGLKDLSISRTNFDWGIPFPEDKEHVIYVWFDALFNYYSGAGKNHEFWPADVHLLGKDNAWFHAVYWPAFLKSSGLKLPKTVFVHGFLTFNGQKISKSLGNVTSPITLKNKYGADSVRYFICRQFPFAEGNDGDFSETALIDRYNNELANKLGNLVSRVSALIEKYGMKKTENKLLKKLNLKIIEKHFENYEFDKSLNEIFAFIDLCNEYIQNKKPWETQDKKVLYEVADSIKAIAILLWPFIPSTSEKIAKQFNFKIKFNEIKKLLNEKIKIVKEEVLFKKIESGVNLETSPPFFPPAHPKVDKLKFQQKNKLYDKIKLKNNIKSDNKINKDPAIKEIMEGLGVVEFADWQKLDLRVAEIISVEDIGQKAEPLASSSKSQTKGADKLYKITLDAGELGKKIICAGLKPFYKKENLKGKKIIYFSNLKPRLMKGIESQGMLLAASTKEHERVVLIIPEKDIENGCKVS